MARKADAKGGNGDVVFYPESGTARKYLRNTSSPDKVLRFKQELEILKKVENLGIPNIVEIENVFISEEKTTDSYVEMKKYDGSLYDLFDITKGNVKLSLRLILPIIKALFRLSCCTPAVYHRDIKPDNILFLNESGNISLYLTDFGTCFLKDGSARITPQEMAIGPRMFIAPEYEVGRVEDVDEKGDIFSVGKVIWCMINGEKDEFLPSNFWFTSEYNLVNRFPNVSDMIGANVIIASCLGINPKDRCDYPSLITQIESFIDESESVLDADMKQKVRQFQEKRKMELVEIKEKNRLLVNRFSQCYVEALQQLIAEYSDFELLQILYEEYRKKSKDGVDYTSINVENNSAHYLYSRSYDRIYIAIEYHPALGEERYCNISISYSVSSSGLRNIVQVFFSDKNTMVCKYNDVTDSLCVSTLIKVMNLLILDYIADKP